MSRLSRDSDFFERGFLAHSLLTLRAGRTRCADCARTPLIGERVHVYDAGRLVCTLCRSRRSEEPQRSELVHSAEHGHAVRLTARAA